MATVTGGKALDKRLREMERKLLTAKWVSVGFHPDASYPETPRATLRTTYANRKRMGVQGPAAGGGEGAKPVAYIAAIQNFGDSAKGIPPRPFFTNAVEGHKGEWAHEIGAVLVAAHYDASLALERMGLRIKGQIQDSIQELDSPPLAASTVKRKGFDKPLIDTSHMLNSVKEVVE